MQFSIMLFCITDILYQINMMEAMGNFARTRRGRHGTVRAGDRFNGEVVEMPRALLAVRLERLHGLRRRPRLARKIAEAPSSLEAADEERRVRRKLRRETVLERSNVPLSIPTARALREGRRL